MAAFEQFVNLEEFEEEAKRRLSEHRWSVLVGTLERGLTYATCNDDFKSIKVRPRALKDVSVMDLSTTLLGEKVSFPVGVSPTASHLFYSKGGEVSTAKACSLMDTCMILSTFSDQSIDQIGKELTQGIAWMNVYIFKNRQATLWLVREAERSGFKAIVATVDQTIFPAERMRGGGGKGLLSNLDKAGIREIAATDRIDDTLTWDDFSWLVNNTKLPVVAKGIMTAEDAVLAVKHGASGVLVSNHGGRLLDGGPSTIAVLSEIVAVVGDEVEIYLDGGVRYGTDVLKALALGARAVFIGRPVLWGLTCGDQAGVERVLTILKNQFTTAMALSGSRTLGDINDNCLWKSSKI